MCAYSGAGTSYSLGKDKCSPSTEVIKTLAGSLHLSGVLSSLSGRFSAQRAYWALTGHNPKMSTVHRLSKGNSLSVNVPSPQRNFAWPFGTGAQSGPITVSGEMRFSD